MAVPKGVLEFWRTSRVTNGMDFARVRTWEDVSWEMKLPCKSRQEVSRTGQHCKDCFSMRTCSYGEARIGSLFYFMNMKVSLSECFIFQYEWERELARVDRKQQRGCRWGNNSFRYVNKDATRWLRFEVHGNTTADSVTGNRRRGFIHKIQGQDT